MGFLWSDAGNTFYTKGSHKVKESNLINRSNELDNCFRVLDIPGFGDKESDAAIRDGISKYCSEMDFIFYVIDS